MVAWEPSLRHLRAFEATASLASVSRAAEKLHLSQSAISQSIANLETSLGATLFQRGPSGSFLTREGETFLLRVSRALTRMETALAAAVDTGRIARGRIGEPMPGNVTSAQISALIAIDDHDSYSAAARALGVTQPSLNRHARDIETILRRSLFRRTSKGKTTTRHGRDLARQLRLAMNEVRAGQEELASMSGDSHGTIVIGILPLGASLLVSQALGLLSKAYPRLKAQIVESPFEALLSWLQSGRVDVIIGTLRSSPFSDEFSQEPLFPDPYCLVVRKGHPLCAVDTIAEVDLRHYEWILPRDGTPRRTAVEALFRSFDQRPHTIVETSSMGLTRDLLLNGDRVTLLSRDQIIFEDRLGLLSTLDFALPRSTRVIGSIARSDWLPTELQKRFLATLAELSQQHSPQGQGAA